MFPNRLLLQSRQVFLAPDFTICHGDLGLLRANLLLNTRVMKALSTWIFSTLSSGSLSSCIFHSPLFFCWCTCRSLSCCRWRCSSDSLASRLWLSYLHSCSLWQCIYIPCLLASISSMLTFCLWLLFGSFCSSVEFLIHLWTSATFIDKPRSLNLFCLQPVIMCNSQILSSE